MGSKYEHVFAPIRIRGVDFKNRIELAPPSPNRADKEGKVTPEFIDWFRPFAKGGAAILDVGNSLIDFTESRDEERQLDLSTDEAILPLSRFSEMCEGFGAHASLEINHCGADAAFEKTGRPAIGPSSIIPISEQGRAAQFGRKPIPTIEMDYDKINETVIKYAEAAFRCKRAGMKIALIHGGHGNLISQFASKLYNKRTDDYGGSLKNRARFAIEVLDAVRSKCGEDFVIEYRISADEIHPEGMHFEETLKFIELIQDKVDILHVSAGLHGDFAYFRNWYQNYAMDRLYNVHFAADIKKAFPNLLVNTVGSIMNIRYAQEIIETGQADFVSMCRPLIADPEMPRKYALGKDEDYRPCLRCQYCGARLLGPAVIGCAVNPLCAYIDEFPDGKVKKADKVKKVAVVGGGPGGIQALLTLCERGHQVTLYEKSDHLGGNLVPAAAPPMKTDVLDYLNYMVCQAGKTPARILLNTEATRELLDRENYEAIIIAVGADPLIPSIPGIDKPHVHWAPDAETGKTEASGKIVVIGAGAVGVECAIHLGEEGKEVSIVEMAPDLSGLTMSSGGATADLVEMLEEHHIPIHLNCRLAEITDHSVVCLNTRTDEQTEFPADTVLFALGMKPRHAAADSLRRCAPETEVFIVGDAVESGNIATAVNSAFMASAYI